LGINTERIIIKQGAGIGNYAALIAAHYQFNGNGWGGYGDWYLPSYHELTLLFNQKSLSGLNMNIGEWWYWSSTEMTNIGAWTVKFKDGYTNNQTQKNNAGVLVRAIRHF
jgi:hypothetical protein